MTLNFQRSYPEIEAFPEEHFYGAMTVAPWSRQYHPPPYYVASEILHVLTHTCDVIVDTRAAPPPLQQGPYCLLIVSTAHGLMPRFLARANR